MVTLPVELLGDVEPPVSHPYGPMVLHLITKLPSGAPPKSHIPLIFAHLDEKHGVPLDGKNPKHAGTFRGATHVWLERPLINIPPFTIEKMRYKIVPAEHFTVFEAHNVPNLSITGLFEHFKNKYSPQYLFHQGISGEQYSVRLIMSELKEELPSDSTMDQKGVRSLFQWYTAGGGKTIAENRHAARRKREFETRRNKEPAPQPDLDDMVVDEEVPEIDPPVLVHDTPQSETPIAGSNQPAPTAEAVPAPSGQPGEEESDPPTPRQTPLEDLPIPEKVSPLPSPTPQATSSATVQVKDSSQTPPPTMLTGKPSSKAHPGRQLAPQGTSILPRPEIPRSVSPKKPRIKRIKRPSGSPQEEMVALKKQRKGTPHMSPNNTTLNESPSKPPSRNTPNKPSNMTIGDCSPTLAAVASRQ